MQKLTGWICGLGLSLALAVSLAIGGEEPKTGSRWGFPLPKPKAKGDRLQGETRQASDEAPAEIQWVASPRAGLQQARAQGQPLLLVFGGKRCSWCRKLEKDTLSDPQVARLVNEQFVALHLDVEEHAELSEALEVEGLPTTVILSSELQVVSRTEGFQAAAKYRKTLLGALQKVEGESPERVMPAEGTLEKPARKR